MLERLNSKHARSIDRKSVSNLLDMGFTQYEHDMLREVSAAQFKSFASDGWCDRLKRDLEGSSVSFISADWKLRHLIVDFHRIRMDTKHRTSKVKAAYFEKLFNK